MYEGEGFGFLLAEESYCFRQQEFELFTFLSEYS